MDDFTLNWHMAEVCGLPLREGVPVRGDEQPPGDEPWNPAHNWNQVHEYVLPACERLGWNWKLSAKDAGNSEVEIGEARLDGIYAFRSCGTQAALCRCVCEAAWEAYDLWQKLKEES